MLAIFNTRASIFDAYAMKRAYLRKKQVMRYSALNAIHPEIIDNYLLGQTSLASNSVYCLPAEIAKENRGHFKNIKELVDKYREADEGELEMLEKRIVLEDIAYKESCNLIQTYEQEAKNNWECIRRSWIASNPKAKRSSINRTGKIDPTTLGLVDDVDYLKDNVLPRVLKLLELMPIKVEGVTERPTGNGYTLLLNNFKLFVSHGRLCESLGSKVYLDQSANERQIRLVAGLTTLLDDQSEEKLIRQTVNLLRTVGVKVLSYSVAMDEVNILEDDVCKCVKLERIKGDNYLRIILDDKSIEVKKPDVTSVTRIYANQNECKEYVSRLLSDKHNDSDYVVL